MDSETIARESAVNGLLQDFRYAFRTLRRDGGFTLVAVLTLALGISVTVTLFTLADSVLLRPLPWPEADRLVRVEERRGGLRGRTPWSLTNGTYHTWREAATTIEGLGAWMSMSQTLTGVGDPERVAIAATTPSIFTILKAHPMVGRPLTEDDAQYGALLKAILSFGFWQQRFGGDSNVIGRTIQLDDTRYDIVGVMPREFAFPDRHTRLWIPLRPLSLMSADGRQMRVILVEAIARLRPGVTAAQAAAEATARARTVPDIRQAALSFFGSRGEVSVSASSVLEILTAEVRPAIVILLFGVALLFTASVANVVSVQLARATARRLDTAIRTALGGGMWRLTRVWLAESALVGLSAGLLGLALATAFCELLPAFLPPDFPRIEGIRLDARSIIFSLVITLVVSIVCGTIPPVFSKTSNLARALSEEGIAAVGLAMRTRSARIRTTLMIGQVAIACVLLIVGALLARSFMAMIHAERGYDASNVLTARLTFPHSHEGSGAHRVQVLEALQERLHAVRGIRHAAFGNGLPLVHHGNNFGRVIPSPRDGTASLHIAATWRVVSPDYIDALRLRVGSGRSLHATDVESSPGAIVVNRSFAREYLSGDAVGQRLQLQLSSQSEWEVVGVVDDVRQGDITESARPEFFVSYRQVPDAVAFDPMLVLRTDADPMLHISTIRALIREVEPSLVLDSITTMEDRIMSSLARPRLYALVLGGLALLALMVTGVGLFGVLSYTTARRQPEIGVRAALGAAARDIMGLVLRQAAGIVAAGLVLGVAVTLVTAKSLSTVLYGITAHDAVSFLVGPLIIVVVAIAAVIVPARRAMRVDPLLALRAH